MSVRRVIFTSDQNLTPPFPCQYLIFFSDFFFTLEISFGSLRLPKNRNLKKIPDLKFTLDSRLVENEISSSHITRGQVRLYDPPQRVSVQKARESTSIC